MKVLRLLVSVGPTSAPYNQFTLGMVNHGKQTVCSYFQTECEVTSNVIYHEGNGTARGMLSLLRNILAHNDYDIIHIHSGHMGLMLILTLFPFNLRILRHTVFTIHTSFHLLGRRNKVMVILTALFVKKICACSISSLKSLPIWLNKLLGKRLCCIVNGYDEKRIEQSYSQLSEKKKLFENLSGLKIVCVGALNDNKNQINILNALNNDFNKKVEIIFIGDGPERKRLENFANNLNSNIYIRFEGKVSREMAIQYMLEAEIFISMSKGEGMPIAALEAMGAGCYSILSDIPPHREINSPKESCKLLNPNSSEDLLIHLIELSKMEKDLIVKKGLKAKNHVLKTYSLRSMLDKYERLYNSIAFVA